MRLEATVTGTLGDLVGKLTRGTLPPHHPLALRVRRQPVP
jgi:hypothetical protein